MAHASEEMADRLRIWLSWPPDGRPEPPITIHIWVEDVSLLDAAAESIAELHTKIEDSDAVDGPFDVNAERHAGRRYNVRVHVDRSGDGSIASGDLLTTVAEPLTDMERDITAQLQPVK